MSKYDIETLFGVILIVLFTAFFVFMGWQVAAEHVANSVCESLDFDGGSWNGALECIKIVMP